MQFELCIKNFHFTCVYLTAEPVENAIGCSCNDDCCRCCCFFLLYPLCENFRFAEQNCYIFLLCFFFSLFVFSFCVSFVLHRFDFHIYFHSNSNVVALSVFAKEFHFNRFHSHCLIQVLHRAMAAHTKNLCNGK